MPGHVCHAQIDEVATAVSPLLAVAGFVMDGAFVVHATAEPGGLPDELHPAHSHPFDSLIIVLEGEQLMNVDGVDYECGPGTVVYVPANAPHFGRVSGDKRLRVVEVFGDVYPERHSVARHQLDPHDHFLRMSKAAAPG